MPDIDNDPNADFPLDAPVKHVDPGALATLTTGIMLCAKFSMVGEAAEWLLGHEVFTHEFVVPEIKQALAEAVLAQHPGMPTAIEDGDWAACRSRLVAHYGLSVPIRRGHRNRAQSPIETARQVMS